MDESQQVIRAARQVADAIAQRDLASLRRLLAEDFAHRTPGGETRAGEAFLAGIADIPGDIVFVRLDSLKVDIEATSALVTGIQHARIRIDGQEIDDRRAFVDWFVLVGGQWQLRVAVDQPAAASSAT